MAEEFIIKMDTRLAQPEGAKIPLSQQNPQNVIETFQDLLQASLKRVDNLQQRADVLMQKTASGEIYDLHQVMVAVEEARIALDLTMQIRNKVIEAYQEVSRMQV